VSDEIPNTPDKAVQLYIGTVSWILVLEGVSMMLHGESAWASAGAIVSGTILFWVAYKWPALKTSAGPQLSQTLGRIATDARWWMGALFLFLLALILFPAVQKWTIPSLTVPDSIVVQVLGWVWSLLWLVPGLLVATFIARQLLRKPASGAPIARVNAAPVRPPAAFAQVAAPSPPAPPPRDTTSAYDLPKKLELLDKAIDLLQGEFAAILQEENILRRGAPLAFQQGLRDEVFNRFLAFRKRMIDAQAALRALQTPKYPDISSALNQDVAPSFNPAMEACFGALAETTPERPPNYVFWMSQYWNALQTQSSVLDRWRAATLEKALKFRNELSR
jgi:hypothetical protein